jgi:hypothetical protein
MQFSGVIELKCLIASARDKVSLPSTIGSFTAVPILNAPSKASLSMPSVGGGDSFWVQALSSMRQKRRGFESELRYFIGFEFAIKCNREVRD